MIFFSFPLREIGGGGERGGRCQGELEFIQDLFLFFLGVKKKKLKKGKSDVFAHVLRHFFSSFSRENGGFILDVLGEEVGGVFGLRI